MNGLDGARTKVPLTTEDLTVDLQKVLEADVFREWVASIDGDEKLFVTAIEVQSVDMFGPRIGFIKFKSRALVNIGGDEGVVEVPGIVFMRGGAVGVLVILECEGEEHTILTYQARVPIGESALPENLIEADWYPVRVSSKRGISAQTHGLRTRQLSSDWK